jgi:hypothetical protein
MDEITPNQSAEHLLKGASRLRFRSAADSLEAVREGVHRWWWEFLRLSKPYWLVCQTSQRTRIATQDREIIRVYRAFGDIYSCTFDEWWIDRGSWVFREREQFPKVKEVAREPRERPSQNVARDHVWVDIPLKLSMRTIQRQLGKILKEKESQRLSNRLELSTSAFRLNPVYPSGQPILTTGAAIGLRCPLASNDVAAARRCGCWARSAACPSRP